MKTLLLQIFADLSDLPDSVREPLEGYLYGQGNLSEQAKATRRYQLARALATTFEEYIYSRFAMLRAWENGRTYLGEDNENSRQIEKWQSELWRRLVATPGYEPLPRAFEKVREAIATDLQNNRGGAVHLFGFAGFGACFLQMLQSLGELVDVHFYFCSPPGLLEGSAALNSVFSSWAAMGEVTLKQLGEMSEIEEIRSGQNSPALPTLKFLQCPGLRREVEVVVNEIWKRMGEDETLRFSDIAIVMPEESRETYLAHLESVTKEFHGLPIAINGASLQGRSAILDALELLLALPASRFERRDLLALLVHPNFLGRFRDVDEATWLRWIEKLHILYGANWSDQRRRGSYLKQDLFNWEQAMRRLALGTFLQVADGPDGGRIEVGDHVYLPEDVAPSEVLEASALNGAVSLLIDDALWIRDKEGGFRLHEWAQIFVALIDTYVVCAESDEVDYEEEVATIHRVKEALTELARLPDIGPVCYRTAYLFAMDRLANLMAPVGQRLTGGVVVATTKRLRALPFRHIFVLGAGEGIFPAADPRGELDLRLAAPEEGDTPPSQRDKYHFLEILNAATESLSLSWVARDASTGEALPPSSIISDLQRMAEVEQLRAQTVVHPLRRYERDAYSFDDPISPAVNLHPQAFVEQKMRALREAWKEDLPPWRVIWTGRAFVEVQRLLEKWSGDEDWRGRRFLLGMIEAPEQEEAPWEGQPVEVSISKLSSFLKSPLQAKAKTAHRIYDDEEDALARRRESFGLDNLTKHILLNRAFERLMEAPEQLGDVEATEAAIREVMDREFRPGELPVEVFEEVVVADLAEKVALACTNLATHFASHLEFDPKRPAHRFEFALASQGQKFPALSVPVDVGAGESLLARVVGKTAIYAHESGLFLSVNTRDNVKGTDHLDAYISHLVLSAHGEDFEGVARRSVIAPAKAWKRGPSANSYKGSFVLELRAVSADQAKMALAALIRGLLIEDRTYLLPIEMVEEIAKSGGLSQAEAWRFAIEQDGKKGRWGGGIRTQYGPVKDHLLYPPPPNPQAVVAERFGYHEKLSVSLEEEGR